MINFSIEGAKLKKEGVDIPKSVARKVTVTIHPCNKAAEAGLMPEGKPEEEFKASNFFKSENMDFEVNVIEENPTLAKLERLIKNSEGEMLSSLEKVRDQLAFAMANAHLNETLVKKAWGKSESIISDLRKDLSEKKITILRKNYDVAPSRLTGNAALAKEDLGRELHKGEKGDWKKEGYTLSHKPHPYDESYFEIHAHDKDGKKVGHAEFQHTDDGKHIRSYDDGLPYMDTTPKVRVDSAHQRKGLASAMYEHAEKVSGKKLKNVGKNKRTDSGKALWDQPERKFGLKKSLDSLSMMNKSEDLFNHIANSYPELNEKQILLISAGVANRILKKSEEKLSSMIDNITSKKKLEKGENGDWKKEGFTISHSTDEEGNTIVKAHHPKYGHVGSAVLEPYKDHNGKVTHYPGYVGVDKWAQRKGLASAMLDHAREHGHTLGNTIDLSGDGRALSEKYKSNMNKGEKGDWKKEGYTLSHRKVGGSGPGMKGTQWETPHTGIEVAAHDKDGNEVGTAILTGGHPEHQGKLFPIQLTVEKEHRRKGIATAMYSHAEEHMNKPVVQGNSSESAKKLWESKKLKKVEILRKGSLQSRTKYNPSQIPPENKEKIDDWQSGAKGRKNVPEMSENARQRSLHRLHGMTQVRRHPETGERQFLLHRGMGNVERENLEAGNEMGVGIEHTSSWSPHYNVADQFGEDRAVSAWIPESAIKHYLPIAGEVISSTAKGPNRMRNEHEVVVKPHQDFTYAEYDNDRDKSKDVIGYSVRNRMNKSEDKEHPEIELNHDQILASHKSMDNASLDNSGGRGSKTKGNIQVHKLEDGRHLLVDGYHRFAQGIKEGKKKFKADIVSEGYTDYHATPSKEDEFKGWGKKKVEILRKGSLQRKNPFNPKENDQHNLNTEWTGEGNHESKEILAEQGMEPNAKARALHKLSSKTPSRMSENGGREFLLHRGMSEREYSSVTGKLEDNSSYIDHASQPTSWTPHYGEASSFEFSGRDPSRTTSAWVHEDNMKFIPKQYGNHGEGPHDYKYEHEVLVHGGYSPEVSKENALKHIGRGEDELGRMVKKPQNVNQMINIRNDNSGGKSSPAGQKHVQNLVRERYGKKEE